MVIKSRVWDRSDR